MLGKITIQFRPLQQLTQTEPFFKGHFIQPFQRYLQEHGVLAHALGRLAMDGLLSGENRFPMTWSEEEEKIRRIKGWTVSEARAAEKSIQVSLECGFHGHLATHSMSI
ncbi:hypothetical protein [Pseudomonas wenzhouensis]|uniref:hypothetical protein n=1 Tax=Pseudomonas wenzhouensis TaxID=2906062 RepID=UPI001E3EBC49|nr:hypothetical protein [Pseudomonas wenzhouensis]